METKRDFYKMVAERRRLIKNEKAIHCHTSAAYLSGETNTESRDVEHKSLKLAIGAGLGYIVAWPSENNSNFYHHSAVVVKKDPLSFAGRRNNFGEMVKQDTVESLMDFYLENGFNADFLLSKPEFRIPSKLQKILDTEAQN